DLPTNIVVQNFMWQSMNEWYFWQASVPNLADDAFANDEEYTEFLESEPNPEDFLRNLLFSEDRFTFWNEDINALLDDLGGVSSSNGLQFFLVDLLADDTDNRFLFVRNVVPGSDGQVKGIQRGDVFFEIDGQTITSENVADLLAPQTYTLGIGELDVENRLVNPTTNTVTVTKEENFQEHPIRLAETLDINGQKIGYLMFQRFLREFDNDLNDTFGQFVAEGVTDLVLDLRYNRGGSVQTSQRLASLIYGANTNDLYIRQRWNDKVQAQLGSEQLDDFFVDNINGTPINSLNLNRVFVLSTNETASSSELVINGLNPYIDVILIGTDTTGKNEFSITLVDDPGNDFVFNNSRIDNINPNNLWALQPLVGRNENSVGFLDYTDGFSPNFEVVEDVFNLGTFGDQNEPLLAQAIEIITGVSSKNKLQMEFISKGQTLEKVSSFVSPNEELMILDKPLGKINLK
ncbi:MAG: S41 family peptidase, partial [Cyanobacteria bacterium P01_A01_bin.68]